MNYKKKAFQENQQANKQLDSKHKDNGSKPHIYTTLDSSQSSPPEPLFQRYSQTNFREIDSQYRQDRTLLPTENPTSVYTTKTDNQSTTPTQSLNIHRESESSRQSDTHDIQSTPDDYAEGSVCEELEYFSHDDEENLSPFDINFLLNPDPEEFNFNFSSSQHGESSTCVPVDSLSPSATDIPMETISTSTTSASEFQKLKFVHFQNSLNTRIEEKGYRCAICRREFQRPSTLRTHMYSHTGEKPFACTFEGCNKRFSVESNMRRHLRLHFTTNQRVRSPRRRKTWVHTFTHHYSP